MDSYCKGRIFQAMKKILNRSVLEIFKILKFNTCKNIKTKISESLFLYSKIPQFRFIILYCSMFFFHRCCTHLVAYAYHWIFDIVNLIVGMLFDCLEYKSIYIRVSENNAVLCTAHSVEKLLCARKGCSHFVMFMYIVLLCSLICLDNHDNNAKISQRNVNFRQNSDPKSLTMLYNWSWDLDLLNFQFHA